MIARIADPEFARWTPLRYHPVQQRLWNSEKRFRVVPAGRRSGKSELAKRYLVRKALTETEYSDAVFVYAAPTHRQAKRIAWDDIKKLIPRFMVNGKPLESELTVRLINGARIMVVGMDAPDRIEGISINGIILDEYGNMKESAWVENIRPALADRRGWAWFIGVPEGRNHYYRLYMKAMRPAMKAWDVFHWVSADILPAEEIESMAEDMDEMTFEQEANATFLNYAGRCYYSFQSHIHASESLPYNPNSPLLLCLDFNIEPGTAVVAQEQGYTGSMPNVAEDITAAIGEVYIPRNSNTPAVCRRFIQDWGHHRGKIRVYGDPTGGNRGSAKVDGTDYDIIEQMLIDHFGRSRVEMRQAECRSNEKGRIAATNSRLQSTTGEVRYLIDPDKCPHLIDDYEGVTFLEGGTGEIDKKKDRKLSHLSDAIGYYLDAEHRVSAKGSATITSF